MSNVVLEVGKAYNVKVGNYFDTEGSWVEEMPLVAVDGEGILTRYIFASHAGMAVATVACVDSNDLSKGNYLSCTMVYPPSRQEGAKRDFPADVVDKAMALGDKRNVNARSYSGAGDDAMEVLAAI